MDVTVENSSIGVARVVIDLGGGHELRVSASHDTDRYRNVDVRWQIPAHVTGPREQVKDRVAERITRVRLDLRERKVASTVRAKP